MKVLPPLFVNFSSVEALAAALPEANRDERIAEVRRLSGLGLPPAVSLRTIAVLFGVSPGLVGAMSRAPSRYYRQFKIRKGRKTRMIEAPRVALKLFQRWFAFHASRAVPPADCVYGFVPGRNGVVEAAQRHCNSEWVYSLDLRDFFPSIRRDQVQQALCAIGYKVDSAELLTRLLTLGGRLPQGSPASPFLSNLVFAPTDNLFLELAEKLNVTYTRYADDLVFSGTGQPPADIRQRVNALLAEAGWTVAEEKEHLAKLPARLKVHGLLVHGPRPRLTKGYRNRIRALRHLLAAGKVAPAELAKVTGHLAYASHIESFGR